MRNVTTAPWFAAVLALPGTGAGSPEARRLGAFPCLEVGSERLSRRLLQEVPAQVPGATVTVDGQALVEGGALRI